MIKSPLPESKYKILKKQNVISFKATTLMSTQEDQIIVKLIEKIVAEK